MTRLYFCLDCSWIANDSRQCAKCGSKAIYPVQAWLNAKAAVDNETGIERHWREEAEAPEAGGTTGVDEARDWL